MIEFVELPGGYLSPKADQWIGKWQQESGRLDHDRFLVPLACSHVRRGDYVIDVGAFNGDWTIGLSEAVGEAGLVLAIEPSAEIFELLRFNVGRFPWANVICRNEAIGAAEARAEYGEQWVNNYGGRYIKPSESGPLTVTTLSSLARRVSARRVDFIKIDVEGFEVNVLEGARELILADRPKMIIEINDIALGRQGHERGQIYDFLKNAGYYVSRLQSEQDPENLYDVLCVPITFSSPVQEAPSDSRPEQTPAPSQG